MPTTRSSPMRQPDASSTAMLLGQIQATLINIQGAVAKVEQQMGAVVPRSEHETRWKEQDRRFDQIERDMDELRKTQAGTTDRTVTQQSAIIMAVFSAVLGAVMLYMFSHLH